MSGTSMAAPFVTAAAARYASELPSFNWLVIKNLVLNNAASTGALGGKISLGKSLRFCPLSSAQSQLSSRAAEELNKEEFMVFPNPATDHISVRSGNLPLPGATGNVTVRNSLGQVMEATEIPAGQNSCTFDTSRWPQGFYLVEFGTQGIRKSWQVVKI